MTRRRFIESLVVAGSVPALAATSSLPHIMTGEKTLSGHVYPIDIWDSLWVLEHPHNLVTFGFPPEDKIDLSLIAGIMQEFELIRSPSRVYEVRAVVKSLSSSFGVMAKEMTRKGVGLYLTPFGYGVEGEDGEIKDYKFVNWVLTSSSTFIDASPVKIV